MSTRSDDLGDAAVLIEALAIALVVIVAWLL